MITVKKLRELLENCDDDDLVILSRDSEGNNYSPLAEWSLSKYSPAHGEASIRELTPELIAQGWTEEDVDHPSDAVNSVTLWPGW
jgi:hypothetical protein